MSKIISGLKNKTFAAQSGVYSIDFDYLFTKTGANPQLFFDIKNETGGYHLRLREISGRLYDAENNYFYGVSKNQRVSIKTVTSGDFINLYVNNVLSNTSYTSQDSLDYVNQLSVNVLGGYADVNLVVSGDFPACSFSGFNLTGSATGVGYIKNNNSQLPFKIYSGIESTSGLYSFFVDSGDITTGVKSLIITRNYTQSTYDELEDNEKVYNFNVYGNFGIVGYDIPVQESFPATQDFQVDGFASSINVNRVISTLKWDNRRGASVYSGQLSGYSLFNNLISTGNPTAYAYKIYASGFSGSNTSVELPYNTGIAAHVHNYFTTGNGTAYYILDVFVPSPQGITIGVENNGYNTGYAYVFEGGNYL
jgi:hypothetical protein